MPSDGASDASANRPVPVCILCQRRQGVRPLTHHPEGVRSWTCDDCLVTWMAPEIPEASAETGRNGTTYRRPIW